MDINFLIKGIIIGFSVAAPVGPIGVLCIRRSLSKGSLSGLLTGLGAATADTCYAIIAVSGLTVVSNFLVHQKNWLQIIGIGFLVYLGIKTFLEKPATEAKGNIQTKGLLSDYLSTLGLTITNPSTIASFVAVFTGIGFASTGHFSSAFMLVLGVFTGSAAWWLLLSNGVSLFRKKINNDLLKSVNRISGVVIILFAVVLLTNLLRS